jgi:predicted CoA-binding protein
MPESAKKGPTKNSGVEIMRRLAAVRRAARKAEDADMRRLWLQHAIYFYQEWRRCTS